MSKFYHQLLNIQKVRVKILLRDTFTQFVWNFVLFQFHFPLLDNIFGVLFNFSPFRRMKHIHEKSHESFGTHPIFRIKQLILICLIFIQKDIFTELKFMVKS